MFDLEQSIANWRQEMNAAGVKAPRVLDELENHLREEIQCQRRSGAVPEQVFALAANKIGSAEKLKTEFAKVDDVRRMRSRENLRRLSVVVGATFVYSMLSGAWYLGMRSGKIEMTAVDIVLAVGAMVPMILLGWTGRSLVKFLPIINENWIVVLSIGALVLGAELFRIIVPTVAPTNLVHLQIFVLWALSPLIGLGNCTSAWFDRCAELRKKAA